MFLVQQNISVKYHIKRFTNSKNKDFIKALNIYSSNTAPALKTNTNEITYWLDILGDSKDNRQLYIFGYYKNDIVIGFAQFMYIKSKRIIFIDYMAIEEQERKHGTFYEFIDLIKEYIETNNIDYDYVLTEIGHLTNSSIPSHASLALSRLVNIIGFGAIHSEYYQPQLSPSNMESKMFAQLMVYVKPIISDIQRDTYLFWIDTIYNDHYIEWYKPFKTKDEMSKYEKDIEKLYFKIKSKTPVTVKISTTSNEAIINQQKASKKTNQMPTGFKVIGILLCLFLLIFSYVFILVKFSVNIVILSIIYVMSLFIFLIVFSIYNNKANKNLHNILDLIKLLFDKLK